MGYWNGWRNYGEWAVSACVVKNCASCGGEFAPNSARQKYCSYEDSPECYWQRKDETMSVSSWLKERGYTKDTFIKEFGIETYNSLKK